MIRTVVRGAAVVFLIALAAGLSVMVVGTIVWGDWYLIRLPWGDIGMILITIGLAGSALFVAFDDLVEPVGWWRLLAIPGIAGAAFFWMVIAVFGPGLTGACCSQPQTSVPTLLYSAPQYIVVLGAALVSTGLPLLLARPWTKGAR